MSGDTSKAVKTEPKPKVEGVGNQSTKFTTSAAPTTTTSSVSKHIPSDSSPNTSNAVSRSESAVAPSNEQVEVERLQKSHGRFRQTGYSRTHTQTKSRQRSGTKQEKKPTDEKSDTSQQSEKVKRIPKKSHHAPSFHPTIRQQLSFVDEKRTKILLLANPNERTDDLGDLTSVNVAVRRTGAQYVICLGNLGFYEKISRVPPHEAEARRRVGKSKHGDLHKFLSGDEKFHVPILSIYGDSGDTNVMDFLRKPDSLGNFLMLHEKCSQRIGAVRFFGLGGRFIPSKVFDAGTIDVDTFSGDRTKLWMTLLQIGELIDLADKLEQEEEKVTRILVTYENAAKCTFLNRIAQRIKASIVISATPNAPCSTAFFPFNTFATEGIFKAMEADAKDLLQLWNQAHGKIEEVADEETIETIALAVELLKDEVSQLFLKKTLHIHVSSAFEKSLALLTVEDSTVGFALAHFTLRNSLQPKLRKTDFSLELRPESGFWPNLISEENLHEIFDTMEFQCFDAPGPTSPVTVWFRTHKATIRASQIIARKKLHGVSFTVHVETQRPVTHDGKTSQQLRGYHHDRR